MSRPVDAALEALLSRYARRLRQQIESHRLSDHGIDADDIEQEVRIRLWRALERDPNAVLPASYIQRVVVSVLVDEVRGSTMLLMCTARPEFQPPWHAQGQGMTAIQVGRLVVLMDGVDGREDLRHTADVARLEAGRVGRGAHQQRLDDAAVPLHVAGVAVV